MATNHVAKKEHMSSHIFDHVEDNITENIRVDEKLIGENWKKTETRIQF